MYDVKYAPFADSYIGMAHGDTYEHVKRWLKQRFTFVDTLFDYAPSYNNDILTIRANTTELMTLEIETYTPVYQHLSWYNGQMDKKKIDGKVSVEFSGTAQAATDQEVLIYGGSNVKAIKGITSMNPNRMLIGSATKLVELDAHDCPLLADINANKANLSPHEYLNKVNLSNCPLLEGNLRLNNSPLVQEINIKGTNITGMNLPSSIRNLQTLRLPNTMTELTLNDASMLHTLEFDEGTNLQSVSMTNCNALENVIGLDLLQTPSITLNNSYNNVAELYFRDTTNLSLSNMSNLERVIFTPNNEYETFELINVANAPDYKVTTFNCPKLSTFMTTAPYRESYNNGEYGDIQPNTTFTANSIDISSTQFTDVKLLCTTDTNTLKLPTTVKNFYCDSSFDLDTDYLEDGEYDVVHGELVEPYTTDYEGEVKLEELIEYKDRLITEFPHEVGKAYDSVGNFIDAANYIVTDYLRVKGGTFLKCSSYSIVGFDINKNSLGIIPGNANGITLPSYVEYIRITTSQLQSTVTITMMESFTPNLIPSSADGSLIFSMYTPSNTVAPASGTWDLHGLEFDNFHTFGMNNDVKILDTPTSISMPARYDDYNITIKNAHISPKTHNTMLYPLLVNEDNPITGTLDYTDYAGKHLSWSFAYTDEDYVNIIQPKNELLNSYEYKYNAFYETEYEFDNPYEVAIYTSSASGVLPTFNTEFIYTTDEIDNGDGTYTTKVCANSLDNLPTKISFDQLYANDLRLLTVDKLQITSAITTMDNMFRNNRALTYVNTDGWDTSNVTSMRNMFHTCKNLTSLDVSEFDTSNVTIMDYMFNNCNNLTSLDVSEFDTKNVTSMGYMFNNCNNLTSLDVSEFDTKNVIYMDYMFNGCNNLTSLDLSGFDTSKVINMQNMFTDCSGLTSLDLSGFDTGKVTNMTNMFAGCNNLTSLDLSGFDTGEVTNMQNMFGSCNNLTSLDVSGFDTTNVTVMDNMFYNCRGLTSLDVSKFDTGEVTNMNSMFNGCSKLTTLDVSNWNTGKVTNIASMFLNCSSLVDLDISSWTSQAPNLAGMFRGCSNIKKLDLSNWGVSITNLWYAFDGCSSLITINLNDVIGDLNNIDAPFNNCSSLKTLYLNGCTATQIETLIQKLPTVSPTSTVHGTVIIDETLLPSGWIYDNALVIAKYTANTTGVLPGFNTEFTGYTTGETDNGDGTYTVSIATDSLDNLPTLINFTNKTNLLTVDKLNTSKVTTMIQMFRSCENLTRINCRLDTSGVTNEITQMFLGCVKLEYLDVTNLVGSNIKYAASLFSNCTLLKQIDGLDTWDTSELTSLDSMFMNCSNLMTLDLSSFDTAKMTNIVSIFRGCKSLTNLNVPNLCTNKITNISLMFYQCEKLETLTGLETWDTSNVTRMGEYGWQASGIFQQCKSLKALDVSNWDLSKCKVMDKAFADCAVLETLKVDFTGSKPTTISYLFSGNEKLPEIQGLNTLDISEVTDMSNLFTNCKSLTSDVLACTANWDVSDVVYMNNFFYECKNLTQIDLSKWNVSKALELKNMFNGCNNLTDLKINFTVNNASLSGFIYNCTSLTDTSNMVLSGTASNIDSFAFGVPATTLDLSGLDMAAATYPINIYTFVNSKIVEFYPPTNINVNIDIRYANTLSTDSVVRIFNNLMTTTETKTITLSSGMLNSLTEDQIAIATNKGWNTIGGE